MFTAPTALRAIKRDDPDNALLKRIGERGGMKSMRGLFLAGERSEPSLVLMYQQLLERYGARDAHVVDNWWSTESGSPITGRALAAYAGKDRTAGKKALADTPPGLKPGSAGRPMPGFDVRCVDDSGEEVAKGAPGNVVLAMPLAPTGFTTLWEEEERFYASYLKRFEGRWMDTGDAGFIDGEGNVHIMSRNDDVLNVSAHRLSSGKFHTLHPVLGSGQLLRGTQAHTHASLQELSSRPSRATPSSRKPASSASPTPSRRSSPLPSSPS